MEKNIEEAKKWLRKAAEAGSKEAIEKLEKLEILELQEKFGNVKVGSIIKFGNYPQNTKDKKEPIEWRVLAIENDKAFIVSQYALDCNKYNEGYVATSWEKCILRKWLNSSFLKSTFNNEEQKVIQISKVTVDGNIDYKYNEDIFTEDRIFLLSIAEIEKYFNSARDRRCEPTQYAIKNGTIKYDDGQCWWWLRSMGHNYHNATGINSDGTIHYYGRNACNNSLAVRPALWVKFII